MAARVHVFTPAQADTMQKGSVRTALLKWAFSSVSSEILMKASLHMSSISSLMQHEFHFIDFELLFIAHIVLKACS